MRKIHRELVRLCPGARIEKARSGHYRIRLPNGKVVMASSTPSDRFALNNVRRDVRRATASRQSETSAKRINDVQ